MLHGISGRNKLVSSGTTDVPSCTKGADRKRFVDGRDSGPTTEIQTPCIVGSGALKTGIFFFGRAGV